MWRNCPDPDGVQVIEAAHERLHERGQLCAQASLGEVGEQLRVGRPRDQRVEHPAPETPRMSVATQSSFGGLRSIRQWIESVFDTLKANSRSNATVRSPCPA